MNRVYLTDKEVARLCEISVVKISRIMLGRTRNAKKDKLQLCEPEIFGSTRRWNIWKLSSVLGVSVKDIERAIS